MKTVFPKQQHEELVERLTNLNEALKLELEQCHSYIQRLEQDIKLVEHKLNTQGNVIVHVEGLQKDIMFLKEQNDKLNCKYKEKKNQLKKMEKSIGGLQNTLNSTMQENKKLIQNLESIQRRSSLNLSRNPYQSRQLDGYTIQTKQSFQSLTKDYVSKQNINHDRLSFKIQQLQKQLNVKIKQLEDFKQAYGILNLQLQQKIKQNSDINNSLNNRINEIIIENNKEKSDLISHLKDFENKYHQAINQLNRVGMELEATKRTKADLDASFSSRVSILSSPRGDKFYPVTRRITMDEHTVRQRQESQKKQLVQSVSSLQQQIKLFQDQKNKQNVQVVKLKNDLVNMKIQYSNILSKNNQLIETNVKLQRQKNELLIKIQGYNQYNRNNNIVQQHSNNSIQITNKQSINKSFGSISRTNTTNVSNLNKHVPDGQIPVRDKNSVRASHVSIPYSSHQIYTNPSIQPRKSHVIPRQSLMTFSSLK